MLMIQSLSPVALLTIVVNFKFKITDKFGEKLSYEEFIANNTVLLIVMIFCTIWIILSFISYIIFRAFNWSGKTGGYEIINVKCDEEASLNFFLTIIIPSLVKGVENIQGAISFFIIVIMLAVLLYKTKLFYANPVLTFLGYRFYKFEFKSNAREPGQCICIAGSKLREGSVIVYKKINEYVFYVKEKL